MDMPDKKGTVAATVEYATVEQAISRAQKHLLGLQHREGYWMGELEADASVTAGYVPLMHFMLGAVHPERRRKAVNFVLSKQSADGSWSTYFGGHGDLNASIQAYFSLKLSGVSASEPFMLRARDFILTKGGITKANVFTKIWLALFGQYDWRGTPTVPPEIVLLPNWFYFNIYEFASWSRATIVALSVVLTLKPTCTIPESAQVGELYLEPEGQRDYSMAKGDRSLSWRNFFLLLDSGFKFWEGLRAKPGRALALERAKEWIIKHQENDGSWGGIMLPWVYSLVALKSLGLPLDHPAVSRGLSGLEGFILEDETTLRLLPATSPVWDTAWAVIALRESGLPPDHPALVKAGSWLLSKHIQVGGDWQVKNPKTEPGSWSFEMENKLYPDVDDTAVVCRALRRVRLSDEEEQEKKKAIERGVRWILSMQSKNGGWAAFDRDNDKEILTHVPFADFMSPLDPTCADVTAHVVELVGETGLEFPSLKKALLYIQHSQEADGAWYGRWGVNYIYGTSHTLAALGTVGENGDSSLVRSAISWLVSHQNSEGGWGETCQSYTDPRCRGSGPSTASQTAWALIGLMSTQSAPRQALKKGIGYLLRTQSESGDCNEQFYTGTGFPKAFYLRYDLYRIYFPLMALARYLEQVERES